MIVVSGRKMMINRKALTEIDIRHAMSHGDFPDGIRSSNRFVGVILTQSWCPDWTWMNGWIERQRRNNQPVDIDIDLYEFEYNKVRYFDEFMEFKERIFGNSLIPYVRYYVDGQFAGDSNQVSAEQMYERFRDFARKSKIPESVRDSSDRK